MKTIWIAVCLLPFAVAQRDRERDLEWRCPQHWVQFRQSCYRFIKSPFRPRHEARKNCQAYEADLVSVDSLDEHSFIMQQLNWQDPQHRRWYTSARQQSTGYWTNDGDGTQLVNMDAAFFPDLDPGPGRDYLIYSFSEQLKRWGFLRVRGDEPLLYICEVPVGKLHYLLVDDRTFEYGINVKDPLKIPRGPYFIKQPTHAVFDESNRRSQQDVTMTCLAGGYPNPTYEWFKEDFENDRLIARKIDPLRDARYTISGGSLIINDPKQTTDNGLYHCKATNKFGSIVSESVQLAFAYIGEFNLKRSPESGSQYWAKALYCDPPQHYPSVSFNWARDYFPNLVEEDKRVFVSYDGYLYFSALDNIDAGNYTCNVQSSVSSTGRSGPSFHLKVLPNSNYQQLKFGNNFPKAFPEAPVAGQEVRLECVAFGYPVPTYNWTRKGSSLPRSAIISNYNRVLTIPRVQVEDQGEYVCRVYNERLSIVNSVMLTIRAEPNFTIPLVDKHVDHKGDVTWTCEAFGIPDVTYSWLRNGQLLDPDQLDTDDRPRYHIQDNVLTIKYLEPEKDQAMYQCQARNQLKTRYSSAQLRVLSLKPSFKKRPLEIESYASEGGNVTILCNPEAAPRPKFVWKKDRSVIGSGGTRRILDIGNLIITRVSRDDAGVYTCNAQNTYGSDESSGRLIVLRGPRFIVQPPPKIVSPIGHSFRLVCEAVSEEILDLAYIWTHNGLSIHDRYINYNRQVIVDGGNLEVINATFAKGGEYECTVLSAVGKISARTMVIIEGPPGPPGGVQVVNVIKRSATIRWTDGASNGRQITLHTISGRTNWNQTWINLVENITAQEVDRYNGRKEATIENVLSPWSIYEFKVSAGNELGFGLSSSPSPQYNTPADKPYKSPTNIGGGGGKIGDLTITWKPLSEQEQNGPGIYYKIYWRKHGQVEFQSKSLKKNGNIGMIVVKTPSEFFYTQFDVKIQAANEEGFGPESEVVTIYSAEDMPQVSPVQVAARSYNSTALNVTWLPIDQSRERIRGKLIGHRLKYWKKDGREEDSVYYLSRSTKSWALIVGLQPDQYYYVKVMAYNSAGEGPESERFLERTFRKAPQKPPSSVHVYGVDPSTVRVVWRYVAPSLDEEPIIGYKVRVWEVDQDMSTANDTIVYVGSKLEAFINNLSPGKAYNMRVLAYSNGGDGRMSSPALTFQMGDAAAFRSNSPILEAAKSILLIVLLSVLAQLALL